MCNDTEAGLDLVIRILDRLALLHSGRTYVDGAKDFLAFRLGFCDALRAKMASEPDCVKLAVETLGMLRHGPKVAEAWVADLRVPPLTTGLRAIAYFITQDTFQEVQDTGEMPLGSLPITLADRIAVWLDALADTLLSALEDLETNHTLKNKVSGDLEEAVAGLEHNGLSARVRRVDVYEAPLQVM